MMLGDIIGRLTVQSQEEMALPQDLFATKTENEALKETMNDMKVAVNERLNGMERQMQLDQEYNRRAMLAILEKLGVAAPDK